MSPAAVLQTKIKLLWGYSSRPSGHYLICCVTSLPRRPVDSIPVSLTFDPLQRWSTSAPDASPRRSCSTCSVTRASTRKCTLTPTTVWARVTTCTHGTTRWTISSCCCRYELADSTRAEHRLCYCSQSSFRALRASSVRRMFKDMIKNKSPRENEEKKCKRLLFFWPRGIIRPSFNLERKN